MKPLSRWLLTLAASLWGLGVAAPASGQEGPVSWSGDVEIGVDTFGFGGVARAGDFAGVRLRLRDRAEAARAVVVRLHIRDGDGDTMLQERAVTLNPGLEQGVWMYLRLPYAFTSGSVLQVTVHELGASAGDDPERRVGRQVAVGRVSAERVLAPEDALLGVVGRTRAGLEQYASPAAGSDLPPTAHEWLRSALVEPEFVRVRMPDSWLGYAALEALVWTGGDVADLTVDAAEAVREWVAGGGRLIVVLPQVGGSWLNSSLNPLYDLMPRARVTRREGVDLAAYRALLTSNTAIPLPSSAIVHSFAPEQGAQAHECMPIMAGADGRAVVVRRLFGVGEVTLIGIDIADRGLAGRVEAARFWNRVLGRRADVLSSAQLETLRQSQRGANYTLRDQRWLDQDFGRMIDKTGRAGVGVLLGLIVFGVYLLVAGPGGFALLRRFRRERHSWTAFVGTAAVFTVAAWVGASAMRPAQVEITHLSVLDHVYGQPIQRTRVWFSALLPTYGEQTVAIEEDDAGVWTAALSPWESPDRRGGSAFPDSRRYWVETRRPGTIRVPTRSTVKEFIGSWKGAPRWGVPLPVDNGVGVDSSGWLRGVLVHDLPGDLEDVTILHVERPAPLPEIDEGAPLPSFVRAWKLPQPWRPGERLDLAALGRFDPGGAYLDSFTLRTQALSLGGDLPDPRFAPARLEMMSVYSMLRPPQYIGVRPEQKTMVRRRATHGLDLSRWFTQPCVIVIGQVSDGPSPAPIRVDGREGAERGRTIVRWVYPLPPDPIRPDAPQPAGTP